MMKDLREETVAFMWAMLELNPHTFDALDIISIDSPSTPQTPATDTRDWHAILVMPNTNTPARSATFGIFQHSSPTSIPAAGSTCGRALGSVPKIIKSPVAFRNSWAKELPMGVWECGWYFMGGTCAQAFASYTYSLHVCDD